MNENEIKKTPESGAAPSSDNVRVYNDMDIFDFDAHRKSKLEAEKAKIPPASNAAASMGAAMGNAAAKPVNQNVGAPGQPIRPIQQRPMQNGAPMRPPRAGMNPNGAPNMAAPNGVPTKPVAPNAPMGNPNAPMGNPNAPMGNPNAPMGNPNAPMGNPNAPMGNPNAPVGNNGAVPNRISAPSTAPHTPNGTPFAGAPNEGRSVQGYPRTPTKPRNPAPQPQRKQPTPDVTDIQPDKVVFDASARKPGISDKTKEKKMKPIKPVKEKTKGSHPLALLSKALIYIAIVLIISGLLAYFVIAVANDVFAFVKADAQIEVVIPEYATLDQIAEELHEKNVISYPKIFVLYTMIRGNDPGEYKSGVYTVSPSQNYDQLLSTFAIRKTVTMTEISVTIPEGYTIDDMIKLFVEEKGMGTKEGFIDAIQNGEYDYWFLNSLEVDPDRKYRLEGYLYPDTYYFYKEWPEEKIINKMLANFYAKFDIQYKQECEKAGMSIDDVINLASIIQMEAKYPQDYELVSGVIHNRLNSTYYMHRLDCDATIQYALAERKEELKHEDTLIDHPYNSYKNSGLPPGPISNPTLKAIRAALYPEQKGYYFFISDIDGYMLYAKTLPEHNANIAKVEANAAAAKAAAGGSIGKPKED